MLTTRAFKPRALLALAACVVAAACHPGDTPGVPLYPNAAAIRLPRNQIAQVAGPIATIDGKDVIDQGGIFDLLPGCHIVELDRHVAADSYALAGGVYFSGEFPATIYALRMKAGARYVIRRDIISDGSQGRMSLSAREEQPTGAATDLQPARSGADIQACKDSDHT